MLSKLPLLFLFPLTALPSQTPSQAPQPTQSGVTLRAHTQLVVVDVVVTDKGQNPIRNLKPGDFTLLESGRPQQIKSFEEHGDQSGKAATKPMPVNPPGIFSNYSPAVTSDAVNVLLLDTLNTPVTDQIYLHDQFHKYLKTAKPGAPMAIFGLTTKLLLLQTFTSDPELLKAAINNKNIKNSPLIDRVSGGNSTLVSDQMAQFFSTSIVPSSPESAAFQSLIVRDVQQFEAQQASSQSQLRAKYTLDAINQLARYLSDIPGRKNLIWFSGSFSLDILPDGSIQDPFAVVANSEEEYRETTNLLTRAQVAVYPIDARGAMTSPNMDVSQSTSIYQDDNKRFGADEVKYHLTAGAENLTMTRMADDSGGHAFINDNDLADAVTKAVAAGSHYYTLTYSPTDSNWNGNFRKIQVKLQQGGLNLAYRRGYFADDPDTPVKPHDKSGKASATSVPPVDPMHVAMMHGAPDSTQITLKVRILPASKAEETQLAKGNALNASSDIKGPYRRYAIDIAADPYSIHMDQASDGNRRAELQFLTYVYDQNGSLLNTENDAVRANFTPDLYAQILHSGLPYHQEISVPLKGDFYLRIGLHDLVTNRIGSLEVPTDAVKDLAPLPLAVASKPPSAPPAEK
jgi:VWFA-related protein